MALSGLTDLAGRVLADRYRLLAAIGSGGSGRVYVADDQRLRRRVAVKVMNPDLIRSDEMVQRFADVLRQSAPATLKWIYQPMPEETHATIYHPAALGALRRLFKP